MNYVTHSIGGVGAGLAVVTWIGSGDEVSNAIIIGGAVLGSLFPDIDHTQSLIGRKAPIVSHVASAAFKHRGFLHSPLFIVIAAVLLTAGIKFLDLEIQATALLFLKGFIPGMLSHIVLDSFNKQGIPWLYPFSKAKFRALPNGIKTDSITEKLFTVALCICIVFLFFHQ